jgi:hypothetical protein
MNSNLVTINGQKISWAFIQKVRGLLKGDWDDTIDAFWKARNAKGQNGIVKYIMVGFVPDKAGKRYIMLPSNERENGQMQAIRDWWSSLYQRKPRASMMSVKDVFKLIAADL